MPLHALLGLPLHEMTPDQLREYSDQLRAVRTNASTLAKAVRESGKAKTAKAKAAAEPKINLTAAYGL